MKKENIITLAEISKIGFGILTLLEYATATANRNIAIVIPFILWIASIIIYNRVK